MMLQAITTRYLPHTETLGARIKASSYAGDLVLYWDTNLDARENHCRAAKALAEKMRWGGRYDGAFLPGGDAVFVAAPLNAEEDTDYFVSR